MHTNTHLPTGMVQSSEHLPVITTAIDQSHQRKLEVDWPGCFSGNASLIPLPLVSFLFSVWSWVIFPYLYLGSPCAFPFLCWWNSFLVLCTLYFFLSSLRLFSFMLMWATVLLFGRSCTSFHCRSAHTLKLQGRSLAWGYSCQSHINLTTYILLRRYGCVHDVGWQ